MPMQALVGCQHSGKNARYDVQAEKEPIFRIRYSVQKNKRHQHSRLHSIDKMIDDYCYQNTLEKSRDKTT